MTRDGQDHDDAAARLGADDLRRIGSLFAGSPDRILALARPWQERRLVIGSRVHGGSMGAVLPDGAAIRVQLDRDARAPGAVIAFLLDGRLTVHRVLAVAGRADRPVVVTCGDARAWPDPPVDGAHVLGTVVGVRTDGSWRPPAAAPRLPLPSRLVRGAMTWLLVALARLGGGWARAAARGGYRLCHPWSRRSAARCAPGDDVTAPAGAPRDRGPTTRARSG